MDWKLELVAVPVSDVDRAKAFYVEKIGFNADHDQRVSDSLRFVQLTPPGSACSIALGEGITDAAPGSVRGLQLVVSDIQAAHGELAGRGVEVSEVQLFPWGLVRVLQRPGRQQMVSTAASRVALMSCHHTRMAAHAPTLHIQLVTLPTPTGGGFSAHAKLRAGCPPELLRG
jgi:catechol 2,3-dioxygenase-like lactoylglutathione lyase family enzyme